MTLRPVNRELFRLTTRDDQLILGWQRIKSAAPDFLLKAATSPIVTSLVTAEAKQQLGLPPG
jgi:hypothetical protein